MSRLYPCVNCTEDGYCKKFSDEEVTSWCVQSPCKYEKPSNADRIRAMSDEELAKTIVGWLADAAELCGENRQEFDLPKAEEYAVSWLKAPVEVQK